MAGVAEPDCAHFAILAAHDEQRQIVIDRAARRAAILREAHSSDAPLDFRGPNVLHGSERNFLERVDEFTRVAIDVRLMLLGNRHAEERRRDSAQHRRGVRVRSGDGQPFALQPDLASRDVPRPACVISSGTPRLSVVIRIAGPCCSSAKARPSPRSVVSRPRIQRAEIRSRSSAPDNPE